MNSAAASLDDIEVDTIQSEKQMRNLKRHIGIALAMATTSAAHAQVDSVQQLVTQMQVTGGSGATGGVIYSSAYDPGTDTAYVSSFAPALLSQRIRRIVNVSTSPLATTVLSDTQLNTWLQKGEARQGMGLPQGVVLNPAAVGSIPAFGNLWIADIADITAVGAGPADSNSNNDPNASARFYRYNLQDVPTNQPTLFGNVSQVVSPLVYKADIQIAAGIGTSMLTNNSGRRPAFAPDGNWLYIQDSGGNSGVSGIYRVHPTTPGSIVRLSTPATVNTNSEIGVAKAGSLDRIYYRSSNNTNALTYVDHDPVANTTSAETVALSMLDIQNFMQTAEAPQVFGVTSDPSGNVYISIVTGTSTTSLGSLLRLDTAGRLLKVTTRAERASALGVGVGSVSVGMRSMQPYSFNHPTAGTITRIFNDEAIWSGLSAINVFKPADFNRDGIENNTDTAAFASKLAPVGVSSALADARYDLNGNGFINFKDVKILQSFYGFRDGDADMNRKVDTIDFNFLAGNFGKASQALWTEGDFDGNELIDSVDFNTLVSNYAQAPLSGATLGSVVPEPASIGLMLIGVTAMMRQRR